MQYVLITVESCRRQMITRDIEKTPCLREVERLLIAEYGQEFTVPNELWAGIYFFCYYGFEPQKIAEIIVRNQSLKDILDFLNTKLGHISPTDTEKLRDLIVDQGKDPKSAIEQLFPNNLDPYKP